MVLMFLIFVLVVGIMMIYLLYKAERKRIDDEIKMFDELKEFSNKLSEKMESLKKSLDIK